MLGHAPQGLEGRRDRAPTGARPQQSRLLYLGLQPRWRPGQAGASTAEVRGRHVFLVQPVAGCLPHSQLTVCRRQSEVGLVLRREGAGDPRRGQRVGNFDAARRHCCSGSAAATCSPVRRRTGAGRGLEGGSWGGGRAGSRRRGSAQRKRALGCPPCGRWPAGPNVNWY